MTRAELTEKVVATKLKKGLTWAQIAKEVGRSPVWTTAALLGQMTMNKEEAQKAAKLLGLTDDEMALLQVIPTRGSLDTAVPVDPTIYRFYELVQVYGTTWKELIHEEFGDGIMSASGARRQRPCRPAPASASRARPPEAGAGTDRLTRCAPPVGPARGAVPPPAPRRRRAGSSSDR